jgi:hypothetical protein
MPSVGFEPTFPASDEPQTLVLLDQSLGSAVSFAGSNEPCDHFGSESMMRMFLSLSQGYTWHIAAGFILLSTLLIEHAKRTHVCTHTHTLFSGLFVIRLFIPLVIVHQVCSLPHEILLPERLWLPKKDSSVLLSAHA